MYKEKVRGGALWQKPGRLLRWRSVLLAYPLSNLTVFSLDTECASLQLELACAGAALKEQAQRGGDAALWSGDAEGMIMSRPPLTASLTLPPRWSPELILFSSRSLYLD